MIEDVAASVDVERADPADPVVATKKASAKKKATRRPRQLSLIEDCAGPLVKWAGGKGKILPHLEACLPAEFARYFEPFCGGAALFFHLWSSSDANRAHWPAFVGDANADLIELYQQVARDAKGVHAEACTMIDQHAADPIGCYYGWRAAWNAERHRWTPAHRAAVFLYLNRASFNGLFRLNRSGHMNVPMGRSSVEGASWPVKPSLARMVSSGMALSRAQIRCCDYVELISEAEAGDLVYLDPPYIPKSGTASFVAYTGGGFGASDHEDLARRAVDLAERGVHVVVSSADVPGARDLYPGFSVQELSASRSVSASAGGRARVGELILTSRPIDVPFDAVTAVRAARSATSPRGDDPLRGASDAGTRTPAPRERRGGRTRSVPSVPSVSSTGRAE